MITILTGMQLCLLVRFLRAGTRLGIAEWMFIEACALVRVWVLLTPLWERRCSPMEVHTSAAYRKAAAWHQGQHRLTYGCIHSSVPGAALEASVSTPGVHRFVRCATEWLLESSVVRYQ